MLLEASGHFLVTLGNKSLELTRILGLLFANHPYSFLSAGQHRSLFALPLQKGQKQQSAFHQSEESRVDASSFGST